MAKQKSKQIIFPSRINISMRSKINIWRIEFRKRKLRTQINEDDTIGLNGASIVLCLCKQLGIVQNTFW